MVQWNDIEKGNERCEQHFLPFIGTCNQHPMPSKHHTPLLLLNPAEESHPCAVARLPMSKRIRSMCTVFLVTAFALSLCSRRVSAFVHASSTVLFASSARSNTALSRGVLQSPGAARARTLLRDANAKAARPCGKRHTKVADVHYVEQSVSLRPVPVPWRQTLLGFIAAFALVAWPKSPAAASTPKEASAEAQVNEGYESGPKTVHARKVYLSLPSTGNANRVTVATAGATESTSPATFPTFLANRPISVVALILLAVMVCILSQT
jgi:hypothetical protein